MTNSYFKVAGTSKIDVTQVDLDLSEIEEGEEQTKNVAKHGYIRSQQFFFCDDANPGSMRLAYDAASKEIVAEDAKERRTLSVYRRSTIGGPWDDLPVVGQAYGELS